MRVTRCPCSSGLPYEQCCERYHSGSASAPTAEALMRSRFSAYALDDAVYLRRSWHSSTRPKRLSFDDGLRWESLEVLESTGGGLFDQEGTVRFAAHYVDAGRRGVMREHSKFVREDGDWVYLGPL